MDGPVSSADGCGSVKDVEFEFDTVWNGTSVFQGVAGNGQVI
jgi:hypothetical protein